MKNQPLALLLALAATSGCSVKVDVADESTTTAEAPPSTITEKSRTAVQVGLLVDQESAPAPAPPVATASEKPKTVKRAQEPAPPTATPKPPSRGAEDVKPAKSDRRSVVSGISYSPEPSSPLNGHPVNHQPQGEETRASKEQKGGLAWVE
jgi:hypothetical protein